MAAPGMGADVEKTGLRTAVSIAVFLFAMDTLVLGTSTLALFALAVVVFWMIPRTLYSLRNRANFRIRAVHVAVYSIMVVASVAAFAANNYLAERRAKEVIKQVYDFKDNQHQYPRRLDDMVPEYMSTVPCAKITLLFGKFGYTTVGGYPTLMYYGWAPFERRCYNFESRRWYILD